MRDRSNTLDRLQAKLLEKMSSGEFAIAVNAALGPTELAPAAPLTAALQSLLPGGAAAAPFQPPPLVTGYAGGTPRSFPLQLHHSGRCPPHPPPPPKNSAICNRTYPIRCSSGNPQQNAPYCGHYGLQYKSI